MLVTILTNFVKGYELVKEEAVKKRDNCMQPSSYPEKK